ncbi:TetR/AcrR family transcriptional regulator [Ornithinibacillus salinisoli]|uniref:TetR/AcrR family transcriptional regulator n=1 Tax=Ornithinibacillus salinisoli TaxID=1848459 RepID=A0ABW4VWX4_9BACI
MARERKFSINELYQATRQLLLDHGYDGFTFSLLANRLEVSRGALYKYFENKEELVSEFMVYELNQFMVHLQRIHEYTSFKAQFDYLINLIFDDRDIHRLREIGLQIPRSTNKKVTANQEKLDQLHQDMYTNLQSFVSLGKKENIVKSHIPDGLILGMIFQTIAIPNHELVPHADWIASIKEIIVDGMFTN